MIAEIGKIKELKIKIHPELASYKSILSLKL